MNSETIDNVATAQPAPEKPKAKVTKEEYSCRFSRTKSFCRGIRQVAAQPDDIERSGPGLFSDNAWYLRPASSESICSDRA